MNTWRKCTFTPQGLAADRQAVVLKVLNDELPETELTAAEAAFVEERIQRALMRYLKACLLYTSPSPRDYAASRMPSSA